MDDLDAESNPTIVQVGRYQALHLLLHSGDFFAVPGESLKGLNSPEEPLQSLGPFRTKLVYFSIELDQDQADVQERMKVGDGVVISG